MIDFEDTLKSLRFELFERLSSPLFTTFVFSWCVVNHDFILVFFGDGDIKTKIDIIRDTLYIGNVYVFTGDLSFLNIFTNYLILKNVIIPSLITILFIFYYPKISIPAYEYWRMNRKKLLEAKLRADKEDPIPKQRANEILARMAQLEEMLSKRNDEILELKAVIREQKTTINEHNGNYADAGIQNSSRDNVEQNFNDVRNETELYINPQNFDDTDLFIKVADYIFNKDYLSLNQIVKHFKADKISMEIYLKYLVEKEYLKAANDDYWLSDEGKTRLYALKHHMRTDK